MLKRTVDAMPGKSWQGLDALSSEASLRASSASTFPLLAATWAGVCPNLSVALMLTPTSQSGAKGVSAEKENDMFMANICMCIYICIYIYGIHIHIHIEYVYIYIHTQTIHIHIHTNIYV